MILLVSHVLCTMQALVFGRSGWLENLYWRSLDWEVLMLIRSLELAVTRLRGFDAIRLLELAVTRLRGLDAYQIT